VDDNFPRRLAFLLTAVAELALLSSRPNAWVEGEDAIKYRDMLEALFDLLGEANDCIEKRPTGGYAQ